MKSMLIIRPDLAPMRQRARGFALPSAIFLLVILAALGAFMVSLSTTQQIGSAQDIQGSRAYWAARAAADFGLYQVLDPENATSGATNFAACPGLPETVTLPAYSDFTVQITACNRQPQTAWYDDNGVNIVVYKITALATQGGSPGSVGYIARQVSVSVAKCKDPNAMLANGTTADVRNRCQ